MNAAQRLTFEASRSAEYKRLMEAGAAVMNGCDNTAARTCHGQIVLSSWGPAAPSGRGREWTGRCSVCGREAHGCRGFMAI